MLTKKQRNKVNESMANRGLGIDRFGHKERPIQVLQEAERQVIEAAYALYNVLPSELMAGQWKEYMELDYACAVLCSARNRADEVPELPPYVDGWSPYGDGKQA